MRNIIVSIFLSSIQKLWTAETEIEPHHTQEHSASSPPVLQQKALVHFLLDGKEILILIKTGPIK